MGLKTLTLTLPISNECEFWALGRVLFTQVSSLIYVQYWKIIDTYSVINLHIFITEKSVVSSLCCDRNDELKVTLLNDPSDGDSVQKKGMYILRSLIFMIS